MSSLVLPAWVPPATRIVEATCDRSLAEPRSLRRESAEPPDHRIPPRATLTLPDERDKIIRSYSSGITSDNGRCHAPPCLPANASGAFVPDGGTQPSRRLARRRWRVPRRRVGTAEGASPHWRLTVRASITVPVPASADSTGRTALPAPEHVARLAPHSPTTDAHLAFSATANPVLRAPWYRHDGTFAHGLVSRLSVVSSRSAPPPMIYLG